MLDSVTVTRSVVSAPAVTSYTVGLTDADSVVVVVVVALLLLLLLMSVEDAARVVDAALVEVLDSDLWVLEGFPDGDNANDSVDVETVDGVGDDFEADVDDFGEDDETDAAIFEDCTDAEEPLELGLKDVGTAVDTSVTVMTETVVAGLEDSVTVSYTVCETIVGASDSTTVETMVVCAAAVLEAAEPPSTLTTA